MIRISDILSSSLEIWLYSYLTHHFINDDIMYLREYEEYQSFENNLDILIIGYGLYVVLSCSTVVAMVTCFDSQKDGQNRPY